MSKVKAVIAAGVLLAAAVGIVAFIVATRTDRYVAGAVVRYFESATGTDTRLDAVSVSFGDSRVGVEGLKIMNPPGFATDYALQIDDAAVTVDVTSLRADVLVVRSVAVDGAELNAEQRGDTTNLNEIVEHIRADDGETKPAQQQRRIVIDSFLLENARVALTADRLAEPQNIVLDPVRVTGIGRAAGGVSYEAATDAVLGAIFTAARSALRHRIGEAAGDAFKTKAEKALRNRVLEGPED
jgi:uncharacterized protein involved in outer membrane biogenesis